LQVRLLIREINRRSTLSIRNLYIRLFEFHLDIKYNLPFLNFICLKSNGLQGRHQVTINNNTREVNSLALINKDNVKILSNYWITGLSDGESCFGISMYKNSKAKTGWVVSPYFSIHLQGRETDLLYRIQSYFKGIGTIRINKKNLSAIYSVNSLKDLIEIVIPHFDNYSLLTQKRADFLLFKMVIELMNKKELMRVYVRLLALKR